MSIRLKNDFLVFGSPRIEEAEIEEIVACLRSGWIGTGPKVARFEHDFAAYKGVPATHAAALNSCTAALHLSFVAAGIGAGDEVITTPLTFCATVNAIIHAGATPVLADIDPRTLNVDPDEVCRRITAKTRAIAPVHFAGRACEMDPLMELAAKHDLRVIEDCAHAIESEYRGRKLGTIGDFGCFSFYVTKNVVTGEGGMVLARDLASADRIRVLGLHGMTKDAWKRFGDEGFKHYLVTEAGFKYNMTDLNAALGIHQLARVEPYWLRRREIWDYYMDRLAALPVGLPAALEDDRRHGCHLFTIMIDAQHAGVTRDEFLNRMTANGIGVGVHYLSLPEHPFYQQALGWRPADYPHAAKAGREIVSLPISAKLGEKDLDDVVRAVKAALA